MMLAAGFRMVCLSATAEGNTSHAVVSPGTATSSSQGTSAATETKGAGGTGGVGAGGGNRQRQRESQDDPASRNFLSEKRKKEATEFIEAWLHSPVSMDYFERVCKVGEPASECRAKVGGLKQHAPWTARAWGLKVVMPLAVVVGMGATVVVVAASYIKRAPHHEEDLFPMTSYGPATLL
jgi:hypothetical protein